MIEFQHLPVRGTNRGLFKKVDVYSREDGGNLKREAIGGKTRNTHLRKNVVYLRDRDNNLSVWIGLEVETRLSYTVLCQFFPELAHYLHNIFTDKDMMGQGCGLNC